MRYIVAVLCLFAFPAWAQTTNINLDTPIKNEFGVTLQDGARANKDDPYCSKHTCGELTVGRVIIEAFLSDDPRAVPPVTTEQKWHRGAFAMSLVGKHQVALTLSDAATLRDLLKNWPPVVVAQIMPLIDPNNGH